MSNSKVVINDKGAEFLKNGQMWMYSNNLASDISHLENGSVVDIVTEKDAYLGTGYLCKDSHITVRIFSKKHETIDYDFFEKTIIIDHQIHYLAKIGKAAFKAFVICLRVIG